MKRKREAEEREEGSRRGIALLSMLLGNIPPLHHHTLFSPPYIFTYLQISEQTNTNGNFKVSLLLLLQPLSEYSPVLQE